MNTRIAAATPRPYDLGMSLLMLAALPVLAACSDAGSNAADARPAAAEVAASAPDLPDVLATVAGEEIRLQDLSSQARDQLAQLDNSYRQQRYNLLSGAVDEAISNRIIGAEAEERGVSRAELVAAETDPVLPPTEEEIAAWYEANRARLGGRSLDQLRDQIRQFLQARQAEEQSAALDRQLRQKYEVSVNLEPFRVDFDNSGSPYLGSEDAAVTLVEFSDFECPFCSRFAPTLKRIEDEYGDRVRIVYRQFPIPSLHPAAFKAAEASLCAHEQGEFWAYHDLLFEEQDALAVRDLKEKAGRIGLDEEEFNQCLDTGRYTEQVQDDQGAGRAAGVSGTPALFVNGVPIPGGAVEYEVVAEALDEALERAEG